MPSLIRAVQAQSKLEGVLSGIGGADAGEPLEWELPSEEEEEAAQPSELRSTEEWKQYVATYGQSYTERYFASYYHSQVAPITVPSLTCFVFCSTVVFAFCSLLSLQMLPVYGAAAALDYLRQNGLPTEHLQ